MTNNRKTFIPYPRAIVMITTWIFSFCRWENETICCIVSVFGLGIE